MTGNQRYRRPNNNSRRENFRKSKIMIGIGVGYMRDRIETEGMLEALVTIDLEQV